MSKKFISIILITHIAAIGGGIYGGIKYAESKNSDGFTRKNFEDFRNLSSEERDQMRQEFGADMGMAFREGQPGERPAGGFVNGEIISKDGQSITVELPDGGSRIIFFSESTDIKKFADGSPEDFKEGMNITVSGEENDDGSYTAVNIQVRP